jgi:hypothetical protein
MARPRLGVVHRIAKQGEFQLCDRQLVEHVRLPASSFLAVVTNLGVMSSA